MRELSPREIREQQARLYEQQRAKYAQLVAFHRGEPGAEFPSAFEAGAGGGAAGGAAPPAPPSIEEMREQLRAEGLMQPPPAFDSVEMGGPAGVGSRSPFTVPAPRDRRFALPPAPRNPAWKGEGRARRRRRIGPGAIERLTHAQSLRDNRVQANAAKQAQLEKSESKDTAQAGASDAMPFDHFFFFFAQGRAHYSHSIASLLRTLFFCRARLRLINSLGSEETTSQLRAQIQQLLSEQIAGMSREEIAAELDNLKRRTKEEKEAAAASPSAPQQQPQKQPPAAAQPMRS